MRDRLAAIERRNAHLHRGDWAVDPFAARDDLMWLIEEVKRLRAALLRIQQWDCLNPPAPQLCADHPWLKRLVDEALM